MPVEEQGLRRAESRRVGVVLIGSQFVSSIHAEALQACSQADVRAIASPTPGNAAAFAQRHHIPRHFTDYRRLLELPDVDMVVTPRVTGEDGRAVVEVLCAAYESARTGRKVHLPFAPSVGKPIDLWWAEASAKAEEA